jgi:hypothetical protein
MGQKHKRGGKTAFIPIKVMLSDPGRVEAVPLGMNDLLGGESISLSRCGLIEEAGEEAEASWTSPRHANCTALAVLEWAKRKRGVGPRSGSIIRRTEELLFQPRQSEIFSQRLALVFATEQASPPQHWNDLVDKVL